MAWIMVTEHEATNYRERITADPRIIVGKPLVKGTRIPAELVLKRLAQHPDLHELFEAYPHLTKEDVQACLMYARALVAGEDVSPRPRGEARHPAVL